MTCVRFSAYFFIQICQKTGHFYVCIFGPQLFPKITHERTAQNGIFSIRSLLIWLNYSCTLEIKVCSRAMSKWAIWKSDVPSSPIYSFMAPGVYTLYNRVYIHGTWDTQYTHTWHLEYIQYIEYTWHLGYPIFYDGTRRLDLYEKEDRE